MAESSLASSRPFSLVVNSKWSFLCLWPFHWKQEWPLLLPYHVAPMFGNSSLVSARNLLSLVCPSRHSSLQRMCCFSMSLLDTGASIGSASSMPMKHKRSRRQGSCMTLGTLSSLPHGIQANAYENGTRLHSPVNFS